MIKPQDQFPLLKRFKAAFPTDDNTIFAYNGDIYTNHHISADLVIHEERHLQQQEDFGLDAWVENYLKDPAFRLKMELDAYRTQLRSIKDREHRNLIRIKSSKDLSSPLYGNLVSREEAFKLLSS